jgi:hypothetical protein
MVYNSNYDNASKQIYGMATTDFNELWRIENQINGKSWSRDLSSKTILMSSKISRPQERCGSKCSCEGIQCNCEKKWKNI